MKPNKLHVLLLLLSFGFLVGEIPVAGAQQDELPGNYVLNVTSHSQPLHLAVDLPPAARNHKSGPWTLVELGPRKTVLPALLVDGLDERGLAEAKSQQLLTTIPAGNPLDAPRRFRLVAGKGADALPQRPTSHFRFEPVNGRSLAVVEGDRRRFVYNHGTITGEKVPLDDSRRQRSSYIHPLWGVHGEVLTDDFPADHFHHHGLFWTWPYVEIDGKSYDLWTDRGISQQFVRWLGRDASPAGARLGVENRWVVAGKCVMIERLWIDVYPGRDDCQTMDLHFTWIPTGNSVILRGAAGKSYGGMTIRFAVQTAADTTITVPGGVASDDLPDTPLPWADLTTTFAGQSTASGAALFVSPTHPNFPPTWLVRHYGPLCIGWPGVRAKTFPPGQPFHLSYRVWIHAGLLTAARIEHAYQAFVEGLTARWIDGQD